MKQPAKSGGAGGAGGGGGGSAKPVGPKKPAKPAKPAAPHKPPKPPPAWHPTSVAQQRKQHRAAVKAARTRAKHSTAKKTRKLALGQSVACCPAEAAAASLRLTGRPVSDGDVLALYGHTASGPDAGAPIVATLEAACEHGLAGVRPVSFGPVDLDDPAAVILGLSLPGPHAVCDDGTCWWSWGQRWSPADFPDAVIEEAWAVTW